MFSLFCILCSFGEIGRQQRAGGGGGHRPIFTGQSRLAGGVFVLMLPPGVYRMSELESAPASNQVVTLDPIVL